jgi:RsiW-degrading membrane proteinase PrsW (M82 family)
MKLVLHCEDVPGEVVSTLVSGTLEIGREASCGVRFSEERRQISRHHARIERTPAGFRITDQGSRNGTWINGRQIESAILKHGDSIQLGPGGPRLHVRIERAESDAVNTGLRRIPPFIRERGATIVNVGAYDPEREKGRRYSALGLAVSFGMLGLGGVSGLLVALMSLFELGPTAAFVGVVVAFTAAPFYLAIWLWLDRYDPEPAWILAGVLIWGAGAATFVAAIGNVVFSTAVQAFTGDENLARLLTASISAPLLEEAVKGVAVLLVFLFLRREFDGVLDGIVYAGVVALGFAAVENVAYYGRVVAKEGVPGLILVFVLRGLLGPFSHAVFTAMIGVGFGLARQSHNTVVRFAAPFFGYGGAVLLHFLWNTLASLAGGLAGFLALYLVVWGPLFVTFFVIVILMGFSESRLIRRMLELEVVRGLLTSTQADVVASWPRRIAWLMGSLGRWRRLTARRDFVHAATRLALCYGHAERAAAVGAHTLSGARIPGYRQEIARLRAEIR